LSPDKRKPTRSKPSLIIFDVDGVLVDTHGSFQRTTLETVKFFTGKRVTSSELHRWKSRPGFNDDWKLTSEWVRSLGGNFDYQEIKRRFVEIYWGSDGDGNVTRERWLLPLSSLKRLASVVELDIFTGRNRREMDYTLDRSNVREFFTRIVTTDDVQRSKPDPEGLLKILDGRDPGAAIYVGDNVDDAMPAHAIGVPFVGVLRQQSEERRHRVAGLRELGAKAILSSVRELEPWLRRAPSH
jgi:HAD superfamily hydrolase (TIGR01548 family)